MSDQKIYDILYGVMSDDTIKITPDSVITSDLGISSFDFMQVIYELEEASSQDISDEELEGITTVSDIISLMSAKCGKEE